MRGRNDIYWMSRKRYWPIDPRKDNLRPFKMDGEVYELKTFRFSVIVAFLLSLLILTLGFGQSSNATLSGTVSDAAKALIPGVTFTATNTDTGVVSTAIHNESGTYNISEPFAGRLQG